MCHIKPLRSQGLKKKNPKPKNPIPMSFSKFCVEMVRDLSHCHKIPLETQKATLSKEKCSETLGEVRSSSSKILWGTSTAKAVQFVAVPRRGICWHKKCHFASSTSKATRSRILRQAGRAASSIRSCQNQTKTVRSFKIAKRRVHMKFQAISTQSGLTSILQRLSRNSRRQQWWRHQIFD